jgi:hypothetical protein
MKITRTSAFTGVVHTLDIPVTQEQLDRWQVGGVLIQRAMPNLTPDEREFLMTGVTAEEWDSVFGSSEHHHPEGAQ